MAGIKVHGIPFSTAAMRVFAVLHEKDLEFELVPVNMAAGEHKKEPFLSLNPFGQVPDFEDGDRKMFVAAMRKTSVTMVAATAVLLLLAAAAAPPAEGSYMTAWAGPGCNNLAERYSSCGCSSINLHGGYEFVYQGQTAAAYNQPGCSGVAHTRFRGSVRECNPIGWQSIFIQC